MKKLLTLLGVFLLLGVATGCGTKSSSGTGSGTNSKSDSSRNSPVISVGASQAGSAGVPADTSGNPAPVELETMLNAILGAAPGTAGSSMKQARAAGELLDWAQAGNLADTGALERWLDINSVSQETELATAYGAVLDFADRVLAGDETSAGALSDAGYMLSHDSYDETLYHNAAQSLLGLFTRVLDVSDASSYTGQKAATSWKAITPEKFEGLWYDGKMGEILIFSGGKCRVVIPYLGEYGDTAYSFRVRDRSSIGYCPALEIDICNSGTFEAPLAYYVSGIDEGHFWCNTQSQEFTRLSSTSRTV